MIGKQVIAFGKSEKSEFIYIGSFGLLGVTRIWGPDIGRSQRNRVWSHVCPTHNSLLGLPVYGDMYRGEYQISTHTSQTKPAGLYQHVPTHNSLLCLPVCYGDMYRGECPLSTHTSQTKPAGLYKCVPTHSSLLCLPVCYGDMYKGECPLSTHTSQTKPAGLYKCVPTHSSLLGLWVYYGDLYKGECPLLTHTSQTKPAGLYPCVPTWQFTPRPPGLLWWNVQRWMSAIDSYMYFSNKACRFIPTCTYP